MPKTRKQYPSPLKLVYSLGLENIILPHDFLKTIPASTSFEWRHHFNHDKLHGNQFVKRIDENLSDASSYLDLSSDFDRKIIFTILYVKRFLVKRLTLNGFQKLLRFDKSKTIQFVDWLHLKTDIGKVKISDYLGLGRKTLSHWKREVQHRCHSSVFKQCLIKKPSQATTSEVNVMEELLSDPSKAHWGIPSIQGWAVKKKLCFLSVSSWYNYNRLLKIRASISRFKKTKFSPLRAKFVNEIWHADITLFTTLDGIRNYIYTVKDNFSRKTLLWKVATSVSAQIRLETIQEALKFAFPDGEGEIRLVTDGGPENDNFTIKEFIASSQISINHQIALKDIVQSNSMVEASYRCLKSHFLYGKKIANTEELIKYIDFYFHDHDFIRPHSAHKIYTPDEVYNGANPNVSLREVYREAGVRRREVNKSSGCGVCLEGEVMF